jgi:hypothetical protein
MKTPTIIDGRNYLNGTTLTRLGFDYVAIGR